MSLPTAAADPAPTVGAPSGDTSSSAGTATHHRTALVLVRGAVSGLALGAALGVGARLWMRAVSTDPGFSWSGTLFVLGVFALAGLLASVVRALRLDGRPAAWRALLAPAFVLFAGPGLLLLPGALVGGWAFSGRGPRLLRAAAAVVAVVVLPLAFWFLVATPLERVLLEPAVVVAGLGLLHAALGWGASELFRAGPRTA